MEEYRKKCCLALLLDEKSESEAILHALADSPYQTIIWKNNSTANPDEMLLPKGPMPEVLNTVFEDGFSTPYFLNSSTWTSPYPRSTYICLGLKI